MRFFLRTERCSLKSITPNGQFGSGSLSDITRWTVVGYAPLGIADLALWMSAVLL